MIAFLDTSVLTPVFSGGHAHHQASIRLFLQLNKSIGCCGAHSLAELYSSLTRMPGKSRISAIQAMAAIENVRGRLLVVSLDSDEYARALAASAALGIVGGTIYDAMLAHCAIKAQAEIIYTWNTRHFALCGQDIVQRIRTPLQ